MRADDMAAPIELANLHRVGEPVASDATGRHEAMRAHPTHLEEIGGHPVNDTPPSSNVSRAAPAGSGVRRFDAIPSQAVELFLELREREAWRSAAGELKPLSLGSLTNTS
jgi:hypothetical protein